VLAPFRSRGLTPYAVGIVGVVVATVLRFLFDPFLGEHLSFSFDYLAVFIAAWTGGFWPAIATALLSSLVGNYFFTDPYLSLEISSVEELIDLIFFILVSATIGILSEISLRALARAKKAEEEKDNFMATVAHELRSPISVIYYANSLNRMASTEQPSDQLDVIDRQVSHLNLLIEDLLDVSRVARGKIRLDRQQVDASSIVQGAIEKARPLITSHRHTLKLDVSPEPMPLNVDPVRIEQAMANLIINAAKYTPDGGKIFVVAKPVGDSAILSVRDNGVGIAPEMLPRVFELFVQGETGRDREEGGLGIGLALVRKITEMHGGSVRAESPGENRGSEFVITLPPEQPAVARFQAAL
jgi:signal transduction histidine kinase